MVNEFMPINIQITETSIPLVSKAWKDRIKAIDEELKPLVDKIGALRRERNELSEVLNQIKENTATTSLFSDYDPKLSIIKKIVYILTKSPEPQTSRQIANALISIDHELAKDTKATSKNVSTILSINKGEGKLFRRIEEDGKDNLFTLNKFIEAEN